MLTASICGKELKSPIILGSGTVGERKEPLIKCLDCGAGAVVNRTIRADNTARIAFNKPYYIGKDYMLNADNNNLMPWQYWLENIAEIEAHGPLIISISARHPEDCKTIVSAFEKKHSPLFYELNFSCSHSAKIYGRISYDSAEKALGYIKQNTKVPVFLKLSLDSIDYTRLKDLENKGLLDGYVLSNTIGPGLKIDINTRKSMLGSVVGGLSGHAIKPLVLAAIYELRKHTAKPIIGVGGIETAEDVLEYLILGCDAVQVYTAVHKNGPQVFQKLNKDLREILKKMGETVKTIKGTFNDGWDYGA